jgi:predicted GNAT family acetyltransferase
MSIDPARIRLETSPGYGRYSYAFDDGSEAEMNYVERTPGTVTIVHTYTPPPHRGRSVAATIVSKAVQDFRAGGKKVVPACWFARQLFQEHPDWADVLARE